MLLFLTVAGYAAVKIWPCFNSEGSFPESFACRPGVVQRPEGGVDYPIINSAKKRTGQMNISMQIDTEKHIRRHTVEGASMLIR